MSSPDDVTWPEVEKGLPEDVILRGNALATCILTNACQRLASRLQELKIDRLPLERPSDQIFRTIPPKSRTERKEKEGEEEKRERKKGGDGGKERGMERRKLEVRGVLDSLDPFLSDGEYMLKFTEPERERSENEQLSLERKTFDNPWDSMFLRNSTRIHPDPHESDLEGGNTEAKVKEDEEKGLLQQAKHIALHSMYSWKRSRDDGIEVGVRSAVTTRNLAPRVWRALHEDPNRVKYFDIDGSLIVPRYPVGDGRTRMLPHTSDAIRTSHIEHQIRRSAPEALGSKKRMVCLVLRLGDVEFDDLGIYSEEDILAIQTHELFEEYKTRVTVDLVQYYTERVEALMKEADRVRKLVNSAKIRQNQQYLRYYRAKLIGILAESLKDRENRDSEEYEIRYLFKRLYQVWSSLRQLRIANLDQAQMEKDKHGKKLLADGDSDGHLFTQLVNNPLQFRVKKVKFSEASERAKLVKDLESEVRSHIELLRLRTANAPSQDQIAEIRTRLKQRITKHRKPPGRPHYVPILRPNGLSLTPNAKCTISEQNRRRREANYTLYLVLRVNGRVVMRSEALKVHRNWPRIRCAFNEVIHLRLHSVPRAVTVDIVEEGVLAGYRLAKCTISLPDVRQHTPHSECVNITSGAKIHQKGKRYVRGRMDVTSQWLRLGKNVTQLAGKEKVLSKAHQLDKLQVERQRREALMTSVWSRDVVLHTIPPELFQLDSKGSDSLRKKVLRMRHHGLTRSEDAVALLERNIPDDFANRSKLTPTGPRPSGSEVSRTEDVVRENVPWMGGMDVFGQRLQHWMFQARRLLRPVRQVPRSEINPRTCRIMLQIIRAQNLPLSVGGDSRFDDLVNNVWVDVSFGSVRRRTSTQVGVNPSWNQLLAIPLNKPNQQFGYAPAEMLNISEKLRINLYDRNVYESHSSHADLTQVWEEHWLGSAEMNFLDIYLCQPILAALPLDIPPQSLGYKLENEHTPSRLWVYVSLDPGLRLPDGLEAGQTSTDPPNEFWETSPFHRYCRSWLRRVRRSQGTKTRHVAVLSPNFQGEPIVCCRFVRAFCPPRGMEGVPAFSRFVASIPYISDNWKVDSDKAVDLWCTSDEFLTLGWGDDEEHALLLLSYFLNHEGKESDTFNDEDDKEEKDALRMNTKRWRSYVCCATSITGAAVHWVFRIGPSEGVRAERRGYRVLAYDPLTASRYDVFRDREILPLKGVGSLFNSHNIWANVQQEEAPWMLSYNLRKRSNWKPLFPGIRTFERFADHMTCIQPPINYYKIRKSYYLNRGAEIERILQQKFETWRSQPTTWDYGVAGVLRECLHGLEEAEIASGMRGTGRTIRDTPGLSRVKKVYPGIQGFPLRFPDSPEMKYTEDSESNPILDRLRKTLIHHRNREGSRFALAVYIYPYPNHIGSCWVYIASLPPVNRRR